MKLLKLHVANQGGTERASIRKFALAAVTTLAAGAGALAENRPEITIAVDNLWPTMDPVIGISTTGARVHSNLFDTLVRRNR